MAQNATGNAIQSAYTGSAGIVLNPSGDTTGATDAAAINAAVTAVPATGGQVTLNPSGQWYIAAGTVTVARSGVTINAPGTWINGVGTGDVFRLVDNTASPKVRTVNGGGLTGWPVIDGTNMTGASTGIHAGDIEGLQIRAFVQNFTGSGAVGLNLDNAHYWTEESDIRVYAQNCTQHVQMIATTGNPSFGYGNFDFTIICGSNQQGGLSILNGAYLYHGVLRIRGNFVAGAAVTTAYVLSVSGVNASGGPSNGLTCFLVDNHIDVQVECGSGTHAPGTIFMDQVHFAFAQGNYGVLSFTTPGSASGFAGASFGSTQFVFTGQVSGDTNIAAQFVTGYASWVNVLQPVLYNTSAGVLSSGTVFFNTTQTDYQTYTLTQNVTVALSGSSTLAGPQRTTIILIQAASGGPWTVTWPVNGSPTNASPTVNWPGGAAPPMPATASAVMVVDLETTDGATWNAAARSAALLPDLEQFTCLTGTRTLAANSSAQAIFNATTNGAITLAASETYYFECEFDITGLSGSAHTLSFGFGGTAGISSIKYKIDSNTGAAGTLATWSTAVVTTASATAFIASVTTTTAQAMIKGVVRTTSTGGTLIPQVTQNTANAAAVVSANSWFRIWVAGSASVTNVGDWT